MVYYLSGSCPESLVNIFAPAIMDSRFDSPRRSARLTSGQWSGANLHSSAWLDEAHEWRSLERDGTGGGIPDHSRKTRETDEYGFRTCHRGYMNKGARSSRKLHDSRT